MRRAVPARDVVNLSAAARVGPSVLASRSGLGPGLLRWRWARGAADRRHRRVHRVHAVPPQRPRTRGSRHGSHARQGRRSARFRTDRDRGRRGVPLAQRGRAGRPKHARRRHQGSFRHARRRPQGASARPAQHVPLRQLQQSSALQLKFFSHVGEFATQTIKRRKKLVGLDVIHVHRMLKNPVDVPESLLVTDEFFRLDDTASSELMMQDLDLEGIGQVRKHTTWTSATWPYRLLAPRGPSASAAPSPWPDEASPTPSAGGVHRRSLPPAEPRRPARHRPLAWVLRTACAAAS